MSNRTILNKVGVKCGSDHGLGVPCDGHKILLIHHDTSDTVSLEVDDERMTFDSFVWDEILKAEAQDDAHFNLKNVRP